MVRERKACDAAAGRGVTTADQRLNFGYINRVSTRHDPEGVAIIDLADGEPRAITYAQFDAGANRLAHGLLHAGLRPGDRVALLLGSRYEYIEAMFACYRAGIIPAMVNTKLGLQGLRDSLDEVGARGAIIDNRCNPACAEAAQDLPIRIHLGGGDDGLNYASLASENCTDLPDLPPEALADLAFTSGSTGCPKAVMTRHHSLAIRLTVYGYGAAALFGAPVRSLIHLPIFHVNAKLSMGIAFVTGGTVIIQPKFDAREVLCNIANYQINYVLAVAPALVAILKERELIDQLDLSSLRHVYVGSAPSGSDVLRRVEEALGVTMLHSYGTSETGPVLQRAAFEDCPLASCGRPLPGNRVKLVDPDTGEVGNAGELWIGSEWLAQGYWGREELTRSKFADGWYRSGDLFRVDERGHFYFVGRDDEMMNVGGEKVYPVEVEDILQGHDDVLAASVVAMDIRGDGDRPYALVVRRAGSTLSEAGLTDYFLAKGPRYAVPRAIAFVDEFPTKATGKIDREMVRRTISQYLIEG